MELYLKFLVLFIFLNYSVFSIELYVGAELKISDCYLLVQNVDSLRKEVDRTKHKIKFVVIKNRPSPMNQNLSGFGYDVYVSGVLFIHQPNVPSIPGHKGFSNRRKAKKTAKYIVKKIRNNIIPPTISQEELDSLRTF